MTVLPTVFNSAPAISAAWDVRKSALDDVRRQTIERRERSIRAAVLCGIPNTRDEEWKYSSLRPLLANNFDLVSTLQISSHHLDQNIVDQVQSQLIPDAIPIVFVDGRLDLSWPGSEALDPDFFRTLTEVELEEDDSWWNQWQNAPGMDQLFASLAAGFAHDGVAIKVNKNRQMKRPLHIIHVATAGNISSAKVNRVIIELAEAAKLRVYEQYLFVKSGHLIVDSKYWSSCLTQFKVGPIADCGYYRMIVSPDSFNTGSVTIDLDHGSRMETFSLVAGTKFSRINIDVKYHATNAECILNGLYLTQGNEHVDHHTSVIHSVGHCRTHQFYKGILKDQSRAVFNGKIFIKPDAQGSEAYQTNKNLLLSSEAEVDSKPQLEIDANDVKASHGAAIGTINPSELFYLQSRCIGREEATAMLCRGFADDVINRIDDQVAKNNYALVVADWFKRNFENIDPAKKLKLDSVHG